MEARGRDLVATAAYDLDQFRQALLEPAFLKTNGLEDQAVEELRRDDLALLQFSYRYLKTILFTDKKWI